MSAHTLADKHCFTYTWWWKRGILNNLWIYHITIIIAGLLDKLLRQVGQCACGKQPAAHTQTHSTYERTHTPHARTQARTHTHTDTLHTRTCAQTYTDEHTHRTRTHHTYTHTTHTHTHTHRHTQHVKRKRRKRRERQRHTRPGKTLCLTWTMSCDISLYNFPIT